MFLMTTLIVSLLDLDIQLLISPRSRALSGSSTASPTNGAKICLSSYSDDWIIWLKPWQMTTRAVR